MSKWGRDPDVKPVVDRTCKCGRPVRVRYLHKRKLWKVTNKCNSCGRSQAPWARHKKPAEPSKKNSIKHAERVTPTESTN